MGKRKGSKEIGKRERKEKKKEKGFRKLKEILGNLGGREKRFCGGFPVSFGCRRDFRDDGDGDANRPTGPRRARDSQRGGRQRRWGGTRWAAVARVIAGGAGGIRGTHAEGERGRR
jgi:hypothetical protein